MLAAGWGIGEAQHRSRAPHGTSLGGLSQCGPERAERVKRCGRAGGLHSRAEQVTAGSPIAMDALSVVHRPFSQSSSLAKPCPLNRIAREENAVFTRTRETLKKKDQLEVVCEPGQQNFRASVNRGYHRGPRLEEISGAPGDNCFPFFIRELRTD